jgi:hypothetical protein
MTAFKRYVLYRIKNSILRTLIFTILSILVTQTVIRDCIDLRRVEDRTSGLFIFATILGIVASLIPFIELAGFKNRRNLDTLFFFPIKREKMALAVYISGLFQVIVIYTVTYVAGALFLATNTDYFALGYMLPYYFLSLLLGAVIYSVFMFLFTEGNTVADGVLICLLWIFLLNTASYTVIRQCVEQKLWPTSTAMNLTEWGIIYTPINHLTVLFQDLIEINHPSRWDRSVVSIKEHSYMFFVWGAVGIAAAIGYVFRFAKKGAEKAGEISTSWLGYRILIPIYGYCLILLTASDSGPSTMSLLTFALMIIGYVIYRRSFRLKKSDIIVTAAGLIPVLLTMIF